MTLGQRIASYRSAARLSQGDLAEKLNVSRQSVSKWETDASIPELDKLLLMSDLFHVSLDALVRGDTAPNPEPGLPDPEPKTVPEPTPPPQPDTPRPVLSTQKILAFIFLGVGLLCCVLGLIFGWLLCIPGLYLVFVALVCLFLKNHAGLTVGWVTVVGLYYFLRNYTGVAPIGNLLYLARGVIHGFPFKLGLLHMVALLYWALVVLVVALTVRALVIKQK